MFTTRPELLGTYGMVASTHWLASGVGMRILEDGGNAFDATVACGLTLHVVEPHLNGLGGDAPIIGYDKKTGRPFVICGQGPSPANATIGYFNDLGLELIPGTGLLPAVVPGAFGAWMELIQRHGTLSLREIMEPAIHYATNGYPLVERAVKTIETVADMFRSHWATSAQIYLPGGKPPTARTLFKNPMLGRTLLRILEHAEARSSGRENQIEAAREAFYEGFVAEAIAQFVGKPIFDSTGRAHAGLLDYEDLRRWRVPVDEPLSLDFHGYSILKSQPWGQGPVLLQQLAVLDQLNLSDTDPGSAEFIHSAVEGAKLAYADREAYYGDPDFVEVPIDYLLSGYYSARRRAQIATAAADGLRPGVVPGFDARLPSDLRIRGDREMQGGLGEPTVSPLGTTRGDTCHVDVVDRFGNMVSATPSGGWLQSSPSIPELGFALPTRGQMFWLEAGLPGSLEPLKRPRTTLSPGLVMRGDGEPYLAFGTPGGDQQDQWTVSFLVNHLVHGMGLQEAIDFPNFHSTHVVGSFYPRDYTPLGLEVESRVPQAVFDDLRRRGHRVNAAGPWSLGRISAAGIREDGMLVGAANPRGMQGYAVGR